MYANGTGVPVNNISAHMWVSIAIENGFDTGDMHRRTLEARMKSTDISLAVKSANTCMASGYEICR
jgi:hypothetical protein